MNLSVRSSAGAAQAVRSPKSVAGSKPGMFLRRIVPFGCIAVVVLYGISFYNNSLATVAIRNQDCPPLHVTKRTSLQLPGTTLPEVLPTGRTIRQPVLPVTATIDATNVDTVHVSILGSVSDIAIAEGMSITADDMRVLGNHTTIRLKQKPVHEMLITCRKT